MTHPLIERWQQLRSETKNCLCIGLDPDISKLPHGYAKNSEGLYKFCCDIVDITQHSCIAYKPNISFFEGLGMDGLSALKDIISYINKRVPVILDAKRGDIGNTSNMQARFIYDYFKADATTLHPYMGYDSVQPFLDYSDTFNFVLGLTSNPGSADFQEQECSGENLSHRVMSKIAQWQTEHPNIGVVVGGTDNKLNQVRSIDPDLLFLIPGIGSQGGSYQDAYKNGKNRDNLALINASRSIIYAANTKDSMQADIQDAIQSLTNPV